MFVSISRPSLNLGHVGLKTRPPDLQKLGQNVCLDDFRPSSNLGHVGLKTRSRGTNHCIFEITPLRGHVCLSDTFSSFFSHIAAPGYLTRFLGFKPVHGNSLPHTT